ncbi:MAG: extracellular solute-binding protein [Candidatus Excrementavichristensenella sp.]|jgi:putative aldouronate transport system substrate-binding protein|nr:extracellular solute-binding protein [Bacillota bacterium]NLL54141.1 extracellular solute-binding protein [Clostridiales bacterium]
MKKLLALVLVLLMMPAASLALTISGVNEFPIVDEPYELTIMAVVNANVDTWKDNETMKWYEEKTGVKVNWIEIADGGDVANQARLTLISGDTPDIFMWWFADTSMIQTFGSEGSIVALNDYIDQYSYNAKKQLEEDEYLRKMITSTDGNIYTFWRVQYNPNEMIWNKQFLFMPWFEKYSEATGAGIPETLEEYRAMLEYFRDNDMNGNGDNTDEIPLLGNATAAIEGGSSMGYIMNAFQLWNCHDYYHITDEGEIIFEAITPEYRDGLSWINKLYEDGLYSEEDFILTLNDYRAIVNAASPENIVVGLAAAPFYMRAVTQSIYNRAYIDFQAIPPLKNYKDENVRETYMRADGMVYPQTFICSTCEHPEIAVKWLDYWLSEEGLMRTDRFGIEGVDWEWSDKFPGLDGEKPSIEIHSTLSNAGNTTVPACTGVPIYYSHELFLKTANDPDSVNRVLNEYRSHEAYAPYAVKGNIPQVFWCSDEDILAEYSELNTTIGEYVRAGYASFILGNTDIDNDADWQAYLDGLEGIGLSRYLEILPTVLGL